MSTPLKAPARLQLVINVSELERAVDFYTAILGTGPNKRAPGYANFVVDHPALKLVLFERPGAVNRLDHLGFELFSDEAVSQAGDVLAAQGVAVADASGECCYARQNKVITHDPDGTMWEWYRVLEDTAMSAPAGG